MNSLKKNKSLRPAMMLLALFGCLTGVRAIDVTVGDLTSSIDDYYLPMYASDEYSYSQQIYTANEIGMAGTINSVTFWLTGYESIHEMSFDIYMKEVDKESFSGEKDWVTLSETNKVYSGKWKFTNNTVQAYTFRFSTPFAYSGQGNLLIAVNKSGGATSLSAIVKGKTFSTNNSCALFGTSVPYDPTQQITSSGTLYMKKNVVQFDVTPYPASEQVTISNSGINSDYNGSLPVNSNYKYSYTQQIYTAAEIGTFGTIQSLTLWLKNGGSPTEMSVDIYMQEVDRERWLKLYESGWEKMFDDDKVFSGTLNVSSTSGKEYTISLDKPFKYSGKKNLLIAVNKTNGGVVQGKTFYLDDGFRRSIYAYQTAGAFNPADPAVTGYTTTYRNEIRFDIVPIAEMTIGSGTTTNLNLPTYCRSYYSISQQIYTPEELGDAATFRSVDFYSTGAATRNLDIYMLSTDKNSFSDGDDWEKVGLGDLVFSGEVTFATDKWTTIPLDHPFEYDGQHNMVLVVNDNTGRGTSSANFRVFYGEEDQSLYKYGYDESNYDPTAPPSGYRTKAKNQIRLMKTKAPALMKPQHLRLENLRPTFAEIAWTREGYGQGVNIHWDIVGSSANPHTASTTGDSFTLKNLMPETTYYVKVQTYHWINSSECEHSDWATMTFTTPSVLAVPDALAVTDVTYNSATVNWRGYQDNYVLWLTGPAYPQKSAFKQVGNDIQTTDQLTQYTFDLSTYSGTGAIAIRHYKCPASFSTRMYVDDIALTNVQNTIQWTEGFESGELPNDWRNMDAYGSTRVWEVDPPFEGSRSISRNKAGSPSVNGQRCITSQIDDDAWGDHWLIIPDVPLGGKLTLYARGQAWGKEENGKSILGVYVSPTGEAIVPATDTKQACSSNSCDLSGLAAGVRYQVKVKGKAANGDYTDWSNSKSFTTKKYTLGDVNGDGSVTPADAIMILYRYFNVEQNGFIDGAADVNGDGSISPADAIEALYIYFGAGSGGGKARETRPASVNVPE